MQPFTIPLEGGIPIIPVAIKGAHECLPSGKLKLRPGTIYIQFGSPIDPKKFDKNDPTQLADFTRKQVLNMFNNLPDARQKIG